MSLEEIGQCSSMSLEISAAVLTQNEALENLLEDDSDDILSNWSVEDLTALFGQIVK